MTDGDKLYLENSHKQIVDILKNSRQALIGVCITDQVERLAAKVGVRKGVGREHGSGRARRTGDIS